MANTTVDNTLLQLEKLRGELKQQLSQEHNWEAQQKNWEAQQKNWEVQQQYWQNQDRHQHAQQDNWLSQKGYWRIISISAIIAVFLNSPFGEQLAIRLFQ